MSATRLFISVSLFVCLIGCGGKSEEKFTLPKGDAERGQAAFIKFRCYDCHRVRGVELPPGEEPDQVMVELGRPEAQPRDYSNLVTAIINPSHRLAKGYTRELVSDDGKSRMFVYNDVMTVSQLIDIVAFLQAHYQLQPYVPTTYPDYYNP